MEDTKSLLVMVLQKIFHDRPKIVEDTYQLIYAYNNGKKEKSEYEKTLKSICDMMNDELPSEILVYLLTLVDMPHEDGQQLPIMEKIQKTYGCLAESVRPSLLEYLGRSNNKSKKVDEKIAEQTEVNSNGKEKIKESTQIDLSEIKEIPLSESMQSQKNSSRQNKFLKPTVKRTRNKRKIGKNNTQESSDAHNNYEPVKTLLDMTANYIVLNEKKLKSMYKTKLSDAWKIINSNCYFGTILNQCYNAVKDINKKAKLLRCIENDNITEDILMEEYGNSDILLKECNMFEVVNRDPFTLPDELLIGLKAIVDN